MTRRKVSNPLALAVLACLYERAMHPYEMATTMRSPPQGREHQAQLRLALLRGRGAAAPRPHRGPGDRRAGRRPERTVYRITDAGSHELLDWLSELVSTPVKEYRQFEAGLSFLPVLDTAEAVALLEQPLSAASTWSWRAPLGERARLEDARFPGCSAVEYEYMTALVEAELEWSDAGGDIVSEPRAVAAQLGRHRRL